MSPLAWDPSKRVLHSSTSKEKKIDYAVLEEAIKVLRSWLQVVMRPDDEAGAMKIDIRTKLHQDMLNSGSESSPTGVDLRIKDQRFNLFELALPKPEYRIIQIIEFCNGYYLANSMVSEDEYQSNRLFELAVPLFNKDEDGVLLDACGKPIYSLEITNDVSLFGGYLKQKVRINNEGCYLLAHLQTEHGPPTASELKDIEKRIRSPKKKTADLDYSPLVYSGPRDSDHIAQACWCLIHDEINGAGVLDYLESYTKRITGDSLSSYLFDGNYKRHLSASSMRAYLLKTRRQHQKHSHERELSEERVREVGRRRTPGNSTWPASVASLSRMLQVPESEIYNAIRRRDITCETSKRRYSDNRPGPVKFTFEGETTYRFSEEQAESAKVFFERVEEVRSLKKAIDEAYMTKNSVELKTAQKWRQRHAKRISIDNPSLGDTDVLKKVAGLLLDH